jgi:3-dehydroshikimate dehydratase
MLSTGLVSITFRKLKTNEIIELVKKAGLQGIEWGGDIHVPHGDLKIAQEVGNATRKAGLQVASYGSYYRVGTNENVDEAFKDVLLSASALEAPTIRVWAGNVGSASADEEIWTKIVEESRFIADMAQEQGISVSYEYHGNTLTDTTDSALRLLEEVSHPNIYTYWQPPIDLDFDGRISGLRAVKPWLSHIHAFHWVNREKLELAKGENEWRRYLEEISKVPGDRYVMLEFVRNDSPEQFIEDAQTLKRLVDI